MKYIFSVLLITISLSTFAQKTNPEQIKVQERAHEFYKLLTIEEYDKAKELCTEDTQQMMEMMKMMKSMIPDSLQAEYEDKLNEARSSKLAFTNFNFKTEKNKQVCFIDFTITPPEGKMKKETIKMVKENGQWLADLSSMSAEYE